MLIYALKRFGVAILVALTVSILSFSMIYLSGQLHWQVRAPARRISRMSGASTALIARSSCSMLTGC